MRTIIVGERMGLLKRGSKDCSFVLQNKEQEENLAALCALGYSFLDSSRSLSHGVFEKLILDLDFSLQRLVAFGDFIRNFDKIKKGA